MKIKKKHAIETIYSCNFYENCEIKLSQIDQFILVVVVGRRWLSGSAGVEMDVCIPCIQNLPRPWKRQPVGIWERTIFCTWPMSQNYTAEPLNFNSSQLAQRFVAVVDDIAVLGNTKK